VLLLDHGARVGPWGTWGYPAWRSRRASSTSCWEWRPGSCDRRSTCIAGEWIAQVALSYVWLYAGVTVVNVATVCAGLCSAEIYALDCRDATTVVPKFDMEKDDLVELRSWLERDEDDQEGDG